MRRCNEPTFSSTSPCRCSPIFEEQLCCVCQSMPAVSAVCVTLVWVQQALGWRDVEWGAVGEQRLDL